MANHDSTCVVTNPIKLIRMALRISLHEKTEEEASTIGRHVTSEKHLTLRLREYVHYYYRSSF